VAVDTNPRRRVGARLVLQAYRPLEMVLQVAVSGMTGTQVEEDLAVTGDGEPVKAPEVAMAGGGRAHALTVDPGRVVIEYAAAVYQRRRASAGGPAQAGQRRGASAAGRTA
jgi:hypothetical protein